MDGQEIIERIMTSHWDWKCCDCWVCQHGRTLGFHARMPYAFAAHKEFATPNFEQKKQYLYEVNNA